MNILHVVQGLDSKLGGLPAAMFSLIHIEKKLQLQSHVLSIHNGASNPINGDTFHLFSASFPRHLNNSQQAIEWLTNHIHQFDLLIIHGFWNLLGIRSAMIALANHKKYVIWPHGQLDPFDLRKKSWIKAIGGRFVGARLLKHAHTVCFTTEQESVVAQTYGIRIKKQVLLLPISSSQPASANPDLCTTQFSLSKNKFVFLFLGRIDQKKGIELIIRATAKLANEYPHFNVLIAGHHHTKYGSTLQSLVHSLGLSSVIRFCGELKGKQKTDAFVSSDCFILPSRNENFGIAVVEALQHALPVIISDQVYIAKQITALNGGWVCKVDRDSLVDTMRHVLTDSSDYLSKKKAALSAGSHFLPDRQLDSYRSFYQSI